MMNDYLVSEVKCIEKDKNWVKDKKTNHPSLSLYLFLLGSPSNPFSTLPIYQPTQYNPFSLSLSPIHIQILSKPHKPSLPSLHFPTPWSFLYLSLKNIIHLYSFLKDLFHKSLKTRKNKPSKCFFIRTTKLSLSL